MGWKFMFFTDTSDYVCSLAPTPRFCIRGFNWKEWPPHLHWEKSRDIHKFSAAAAWYKDRWQNRNLKQGSFTCTTKGWIFNIGCDFYFDICPDASRFMNRNRQMIEKYK